MRRLTAATLASLLATAVGCASITPRTEIYSQKTTAQTFYADANDDDLLLLDGNTWLVPVFSRKKQERISAMEQYIHELPELPDVITFQEVWLQKHVHEFQELFPEYVAYYSHETKRVFGYQFNESGLLTLVKKDLPVTNVCYERLDKEYTLSFDSFLGKGSLALTVMHKGAAYVITNIHLPNTYGDLSLKKTQKGLVSLPLEGVLVGDFNLDPDELPSWLVSDDVSPTFSNDGLQRKREQRLDYVFPGARTSVVSQVLTDAQGYCLPFSDHCFLVAKIRQKDSPLETRVAENMSTPTTSFDEKAY